MTDINNIYSLLSRQFKSPQHVTNEIINLQAILNLPKGTEHFLSDLHGESDIFNHLLKNASGVIRTKIDLVFGSNLDENQKNQLATLIYYPNERLKSVKKTNQDLHTYYKEMLSELILVAKAVALKYTRSKVRKALDNRFTYILDELININHESTLKENYYMQIIESIISLNNADKFIVALCNLIQQLAIDHLHIVGDIFDRGNGSSAIMDRLISYHSVDIQWGNHDILWLGASLGNLACICNVIRINCTYRNLSALENGYGINLRCLATFALENYENDPCTNFKISTIFGEQDDFEKDILLAKMTKAITVIQLKLENQLILNNPEFDMNDRILYPENDLSAKETALMDLLKTEFIQNKKLQMHMSFLIANGNIHLCYNGNLLLHGCVPCELDGSFSSVYAIDGYFSGSKLYEKINDIVKLAFTTKKTEYIDYLWYLWCGKKSPLYGRDKMCVYTKYFKNELENENKDYYYKHIDNESFCKKVLAEFRLFDKYAHIISGHMPVKVSSGQTPERGNGIHITIDGGMSKAYHKTTGIGGYTLINNSEGLYLVSHSPSFSSSEMLNNMLDLNSQTRCLSLYNKRILVKDTDKGKSMIAQIEILKNMMNEYYKIKI